jgi:predicted RNA binding protein YcfA (HicA-like mRNA interferase family)
MKLEERMLRAVKLRDSKVILRSELSKLGSPSQVSEAINALQKKGIILRIARGVYSKTKKSSVTGTVIPVGSLETLATETFKKLGVVLMEGELASSYNSGKTTQLPGAFVANTGRRRISRKITVGGRSVIYENNYS